jgi:hypothetical protein
MRTSAAKAVIGRPIYGTAKPVPFVERRFSLSLVVENDVA